MTNLQIFQCHDAKLHTLPDQPTNRVATHEQLMEHHRRLKELNADEVLRRFGTDPDPPKVDEEFDYDFWTSSAHGMLEHEDEWRQCRLTFAWIDEKPTWMSAAGWEITILPEVTAPCRREFRFSLIGGGQIKVMENHRWRRYRDMAPWLSCHPTELQIQAHRDERVSKRYHGVIDGPHYEMTGLAVLLPPGTPQEVADRTAATLRAIDNNVTNFQALLAHGQRCCVCRRALKDEVSKLLCIGPDCAKKLHLPHTHAVANMVLKRRREILGEDA